MNSIQPSATTATPGQSSQGRYRAEAGQHHDRDAEQAGDEAGRRWRRQRADLLKVGRLAIRLAASSIIATASRAARPASASHARRSRR